MPPLPVGCWSLGFIFKAKVEFIYAGKCFYLLVPGLISVRGIISNYHQRQAYQHCYCLGKWGRYFLTDSVALVTKGSRNLDSQARTSGSSFLGLVHWLLIFWYAAPSAQGKPVLQLADVCGKTQRTLHLSLQKESITNLTSAGDAVLKCRSTLKQPSRFPLLSFTDSRPIWLKIQVTSSDLRA